MSIFECVPAWTSSGSGVWKVLKAGEGESVESSEDNAEHFGLPRASHWGRRVNKLS